MHKLGFGSRWRIKNLKNKCRFLLVSNPIWCWPVILSIFLFRRLTLWCYVTIAKLYGLCSLLCVLTKLTDRASLNSIVNLIVSNLVDSMTVQELSAINNLERHPLFFVCWLFILHPHQCIVFQAIRIIIALVNIFNLKHIKYALLVVTRTNWKNNGKNLIVDSSVWNLN